MSVAAVRRCLAVEEGGCVANDTVLLDPSAVADSGRVEVDISAWVKYEGIDWGDAAIEAYLADAKRGSRPVDFRVPNRTVTIPLNLLTVGSVTFDQIRTKLQAWVGRVQQEGGWIARQATVGTVYADVVGATLKFGGSTLQAIRGIDVDASLSIECVPDWYGAERTLDDKTETTASALVTVLKKSTVNATVAGDYPGRVKVVVDEDDGETQLGLIAAFRSRYYDSASTAAIMFEAEALTPLDAAAVATVSGASGGGSNNVVQHAALRTDWTAVLSTLIVSGSAHMTHRGTAVVWARVYSTSTTPPQVRLGWAVGSFVNPSYNDPVTIPGTSNFYWVKLGEVRLDKAPAGTHRWMGQVEAKGSAGGENVSVDEVHVVPADDWYGVLGAPQVVGTVSSYSGLDSFTGTTAGTAIAGRTAPSGGTWSSTADATDFVFSDDGSQETIKRTANSGYSWTMRNPRVNEFRRRCRRKHSWRSPTPPACLHRLRRAV